MQKRNALKEKEAAIEGNAAMSLFSDSQAVARNLLGIHVCSLLIFSSSVMV